MARLGNVSVPMLLVLAVLPGAITAPLPSVKVPPEIVPWPVNVPPLRFILAAAFSELPLATVKTLLLAVTRPLTVPMPVQLPPVAFNGPPIVPPERLTVAPPVSVGRRRIPAD